MALTALEIYKHLPKTNCKECKFPTCLAFAMALAQKKASLSDCPYVSEEGKAALEGASAPPIRLVTIGTGERKLEIGSETVMFRHEQTFFHPTGIAVEVSDTLDDGAFAKAAEEIRKLSFERVGMIIGVNLVAVRAESGNPERFASVVKALKAAAGLPFILMSRKPQVLEPALALLKGEKPLIFAADKDTLDPMAALAKANEAPLAVTAESPDALAELTPRIAASGVADIVLGFEGRTLARNLQDMTICRRAALKKAFRALGYPLAVVASNPDPFAEAAAAATYVAKYAGIVVVRGRSPAEILPILTVRQNIYTDPQKPIQVKPGLYAIGEANGKSPVLVTTNFSLTYYNVAGDVEASRVPSYIVVVDTEGTSVLTAFASDKLNADKVTAMLKDASGVSSKVSHKKVIIPGLVAAMAAKLKDASGWEVLVGPRESSGLGKFLKSLPS
ncbi:MAG TPA: acetyl-CoA decarbonylase/synthase complex subunit gamma [Spirochaetia bacterium]|nr:acetyl-CoA decarbonylase/synthase complex subunit gamma [Spirochaetia bacterium]